jgi:hypothetical protein
MSRFFLMVVILGVCIGGLYIYNPSLLKSIIPQAGKPVSELSKTIDNAKLSSANNLAQSFAAFLGTAKNAGLTNDRINGLSRTVEPGTTVSFSLEGGEPVNIIIPEHSTMTVKGEMPQGGSVICDYDGVKSDAFSW